MEIVEKKINELKDADYNPRKLSKHQEDTIRESFERFGFVDPCIINMHPGRENVIIGGHQRRKVWKKMGHDTIPCVEVDYPLEEERELNIRLNQNTGEWDFEILKKLFDKDDLHKWGWQQNDLKFFMLDDLKEDPASKMDQAEALLKKWKVEQGQVWSIGKHRLMCGDATCVDSVAKLLAGEKPSLMITDPPYGVEYDPKWRQRAGLNKNPDKMGEVANDNRSDWYEAWILFPGSVAYIWHEGKFGGIVEDSMARADLVIRNQIIWNKERFVLSRGNYHWKHEPCYYAVKKGHKANWIGDKAQTTVWDIQSRDDGGHGHGTQKPLECMAKPMRNHAGEVYDPFSGSGTTIIAAEQLGRTAFGMELEPKYCSVILERLTDLGLTPELTKP